VRVTSNSLREVFLATMQASQQRLVETQTQIATGRRINAPSDDPLGAARIAELDSAISRVSQYQDNGDLARSRLTLEEETLISIVENLQRTAELAVQANNATLSDFDRAAIGQEIRQRFDSVLALANTVDEAGRYVFAGFSEQTRPFTETPAGVTYNGDQGQRSLQVGAERFVAITDAGSEIFQRIPNGNGDIVLAADPANAGTGVLGAGTVIDTSVYVPDTYTVTFTAPDTFDVTDGGGAVVASGIYTSGQAIAFGGLQVELDGTPAAGDSFTVTPSTSQDMFATLARLVSATGQTTSGAADRAAVNNAIGQLLPEISQAIDHLIGVRAEVGSRLRSIEDETALNDGYSLNLTQTLSQIRDLDYAEAISLLSQQLLGLEASQQSYTRLQGLSLFRYL
jgi:flagellar hook-associated protein 3 FlgL